MEEVSETEVIQMEDSATVAPATATTASETNSVLVSTDAQDSAVLTALPVTPEPVSVPFVDEEVTFHKVCVSCHGDLSSPSLLFNFPSLFSA